MRVPWVKGEASGAESHLSHVSKALLVQVSVASESSIQRSDSEGRFTVEKQDTESLTCQLCPPLPPGSAVRREPDCSFSRQKLQIERASDPCSVSAFRNLD